MSAAEKISEGADGMKNRGITNNSNFILTCPFLVFEKVFFDKVNSHKIFLFITYRYSQAICHTFSKKIFKAGKQTSADLSYFHY